MESLNARKKALVIGNRPPNRRVPHAPLPNKKWATPKDWDEYIQAQVTRLYHTEDRPLREVMDIMASEYGHHATKRMYISRIQAWGLVKNKKEEDMLYIIRKSDQREAMGKKTSFIVHGRPVDYQEAYHYFQRKGKAPSLTGPRPPTPPHIVCRTPSPPPTLRVPEQLFFTINNFYDGSFENKHWVPNGDTCLSIKAGVTLDNQNIIETFGAYCTTALTFLNEKKYADARRILSIACGLIRPVIEAEDHMTLWCMCDTFCLFKGEGYSEIMLLILRYIYGLVSLYFPKNHPWAVIWHSLVSIAHEDMDDAIIKAYKCVADSLARSLGTYYPTAVNCFCDSLDREHGPGRRDAEEAILRKFLAESQKFFGGDHTVQIRILSRIAICARDQGHHEEHEAIALEIIRLIPLRSKPYDLLHGLLHCSTARYNLGKFAGAEEKLLEALEVMKQEWGKQHAWYINYARKYAVWLRGWGREAEAEEFEADTARLIDLEDVGPDIDLDSKGDDREEDAELEDIIS
ncbi:hypothetical protein B0O99DRAFT_334567 [Bisporella sp. PMI_857]|nr:hypothetical protein B0O99DRAFT_334567 [Bisporella sp. PMI_857]